MKVVAVYNLKGGVGKTTTTINLSYLAAAGSHRTLVWDLDPQAASSFAFRIRPEVEGFGRKTLEGGPMLGGAIKETDYRNLDLLPADFAYRKFDRLLDRSGSPGRVVAGLLETLGRDYDVVFLDCPGGISLLTEGVLAAADAVLVPTIPTVLSLRTLAQVIEWAERSHSTFVLAAFFNMVDRRKNLHRRACEWAAGRSDVLLPEQVPYTSVVEQMAIRRMPLPAFAARDTATAAFAAIWTELQTRMRQGAERRAGPTREWKYRLRAVESLMAQLESEGGPSASSEPPLSARRDERPPRFRWINGARVLTASPASGDGHGLEAGSLEGSDDLVHGFDTDNRDLQRRGHALELREHQGTFVIVATRPESVGRPSPRRRAQVQIDASWAVDILSGVMSPLAAFARRLGRPGPDAVESIRAIVGDRELHRIGSQVASRPEPSGDVANG
jgi:chromosome partitioning protein